MLLLENEWAGQQALGESKWGYHYTLAWGKGRLGLQCSAVLP